MPTNRDAERRYEVVEGRAYKVGDLLASRHLHGLVRRGPILVVTWVCPDTTRFRVGGDCASRSGWRPVANQFFNITICQEGLIQPSD